MSRGFTAALLGVLVALGGLVASAAVALLLDGVRAQIGGFGLFGGMVALPASLALLFLGAVLTESHYPRMRVFAAAVGVACIGATLLGLGMGLEEGWIQGAVAAVLFWGLPLALSTVGLVYNASIGIPAARMAEHVARMDRLADEIRERGHWTFAAAGEALGVDDAVELAAEVRRSGRAPLELDLHRGRLWSQVWADAQCEALRSALDDDGRVAIGAFAGAREVPVDMVREWVYTLVYRQQLTGYVSWREGVLYAADAQALRGSSRCPACGGQLELVARGVVACQSCDTQTLLD